MSLRLPPPTHRLREAFEVTDLVNWRALPGFRAALHSGKQFLQAETSARSVNFLTLRADGRVWLVEVTRRTWRRLWDFGNPLVTGHKG